MIFPENMLEWSLTAIFGLISIIITFIIMYKVKYYHQIQLVNKLPGPKSNFLLGNAWELLVKREDMLEKLLNMLKDCDKVVRIWLGPVPYIGVYDPEIVEAILSSPKYIDKGIVYKLLKPWLGMGLLTSTGRKWQTHRKMITPTFHFNILEEFRPIINEHSKRLMSHFEKHDGKGAFDIYAYFNHSTLDIICETAMGKEFAAQQNSESEYVKAVYNLTEIIYERVMKPWLLPDLLFNLTLRGRKHAKYLKYLHNFTDQIIAERRKMLHNKNNMQKNNTTSDCDTEIYGKKHRLAFLDMLLSSTIDGKGLSDKDIREEVDTFVFEGHDTTAVTLTWAIYNIGRFPEIQKQVHEELDQIFGDSNRPVSIEDVNELKFMECVIKESLRLSPTVYIIFRKFEADVELCGYTFPAGVDISIFLYKLLRNPKYFPDPEKFDPSRYQVENATKRHPYAFVPFSAGPRNCIGQKFAMMEVKIVLAHILRIFKVTTMNAEEKKKTLPDLILRPAGGMWVKIESRK